MTKMKISKPRKTKQVFKSEAEEAQWWFEQRGVHANEMIAAHRAGKTQKLTKQALLERLAASRKSASPVVSLRIPANDLEMARRQAERKGLPYQTYIKSLLHETLVSREK